MDWGHDDQESAMRQRYLEIDDRTSDVKDHIARSGRNWDDFQQMYDISWIYHENGLEGVVLSYPEIKSAVDNKIISDVSLLPTYRDIKNQKWCLDTMREKATHRRFAVTIPFLRDVHARLSQAAPPTSAPLYRKDIPIHRAYFHEIAAPAQIEPGLQAVMDYLKARHDDVAGIEVAANVHHRFMRVFPYTLHSGIIGRLLLNFALIRSGHLPVIVHAADRQRYYEALRGSERDFRPFIAEAMENSLENAMLFFALHERRGRAGAMR